MIVYYTQGKPHIVANLAFYLVESPFYIDGYLLLEDLVFKLSKSIFYTFTEL